MAPIQRLWKHMADVAAAVDISSLHTHMQHANSAAWGIAVLEYVQDR